MRIAYRTGGRQTRGQRRPGRPAWRIAGTISSPPNSDELHIRGAGGLLVLSFGLPFLLFGLTILLAICFGEAQAGLLGLVLLGVLGAALTLIGGWLVAYRSGYIIDRKRRTITAWSGILGFRRRRTSQLDDIECIVLERSWNDSRIGPDWLFRVLLRPKDPDSDAVELGFQLVARRARCLARDVSAFSGLNICLCRPPHDDEQARLMQLYQQALGEFERESEAAHHLATEPLDAAPPGRSEVDLAAWTVVANVLLNLDETLMKR